MRPLDCKTWATVSKHFPLSDDTLISAAAGAETNLWGCRWSEQTKFAALDIDAWSMYHSTEGLQRITDVLNSVGLHIAIYQSSNSGGWHVYLFFDDWQHSNEVQNTLKTWLRARGYALGNGTLEVFPDGRGFRLPLQRGFAWLNETGQINQRREELSPEQALSRSIPATVLVFLWYQTIAEQCFETVGINGFSMVVAGAAGSALKILKLATYQVLDDHPVGRLGAYIIDVIPRWRAGRFSRSS
ncbi:hypothetical protein KF707_15910 [Candidatus Obscuribacterales bacterium]|nr:hypothetical protein [Candidatus Obscuribacterales bacterium]MBX3152082.1 hypothetical protein [Candidatus Obscuribacterales bacterium]